jgi:UDP-N-acetylmuramoylalanine--D-glutamate ligase
MKLALQGSRVLVLGLGDTGWSMTRWLARHGARVRVADTRAEPPHARALRDALPGVELRTGRFERDTFAGMEVIAVSPGINRREPPIAEAVARGLPVVGDVELFAQALAQHCEASGEHPSVLAITGSNGKCTVTAMAGDICKAGGLRTVVAGNIGLPVLDAWTEIEGGAPLPQAFVLELSSFQLESTQTLAATAATVLNVTEDHLDRYAGMADYAAAKARIFPHARVQVLNREDGWSMGMALRGRERVTFGLDAAPGGSDWGVRNDELMHGTAPLMSLDELPVAGLHNAANALAALALTEAAGVPTNAALDALRAFRGLPHRVEKVADIRGIVFYDDSKGTNVGSTVAALRGMRQPVVLIAGGDGKGQDFSPLAPAVAERARAVVLIGRDASSIERAVAGSGVPLLHAATLPEAVDVAYRASRKGDAVLLSPACASYDMFRSYVHRAEAFVAAVRELARKEA